MWLRINGCTRVFESVECSDSITGNPLLPQKVKGMLATMEKERVPGVEQLVGVTGWLVLRLPRLFHFLPAACVAGVDFAGVDFGGPELLRLTRKG